jgi:hypothetical protein
MHKSSKPIAVHMHHCYGVHMHKPSEKPANSGTPPQKRVVGGITLYAAQLAKLDALAARGISRSAAIRQLIDEHL